MFSRFALEFGFGLFGFFYKGLEAHLSSAAMENMQVGTHSVQCVLWSYE